MCSFALGRLRGVSASDRRRDRPYLRLTAYALLLFGGYFGGARLGFALTFQPHPVSTLWPPNSILMAALLLAPTRWWGILLLAALPAHVAVELNSGVPIRMILCWFISNSCEALIGATCVRRYVGHRLNFNSIHHLTKFVAFAVLLAPLLSSFVDAGFVKLIGWGTDSYWQVWLMRALSNVLAALTIVPAIYIVADGGLSFVHRATRSRYVEAGLIAIGLIVVCFLVFAAEGPQLGNVPALVYAPLPFLLWSAVRFGPRGLSIALLATVLLAIWGAIHARGPFTGQDPHEIVHSLQGFLILMSVQLMFLSTVIAERHETAQALRKSEERYRSVVETQSELLCRYKPDTTLTFANDAYCRYFDKRQEELIGHKFLELIPPESRNEVTSRIRLLVEAGTEMTSEHPVLLPDGGIGWQQWVNTPIFDDAGRTAELQAVGRDITERRRAVEELRQSEERWRLVFDNSAVGIVVTNPQGRFFATNAVYEHMLGYTKSELSNLTLFDVTADEYRVATSALIKQLVDGARSQDQIESRCLRSDSQPIWINSSISIVHDDQGEPLYVIAVVEDITERRQTLEALNKLNTELEQRVIHRTAALNLKTRELEAFAYTVAHDLKAPLRGIDGYSRLLIEDYLQTLDEEGRSLLLNVRTSTEQMSRLIDDLLEYSRIQYEKVSHSELEVGPFISSLVQQRKGLSERPIEFVIEVESGSLSVSASALGRALNNCLDNAIKFTRTVESPRIEIGAEQQDDHWLFWVRDNGVGFQMKHCNEVFEIFRRLHHEEDYEGTGVGLAIVRKVIEQMGGHVWAESEPGRGSTFSMRIPKILNGKP